jgi:hypothetical protein
MWRSSLMVAAALLYSSAVLAQHSSGGGGGGGGSHGGSSGGGSGGGSHSSSSSSSSSSSHSAGSHGSGSAGAHSSGSSGSSVKATSSATHSSANHSTVKESKPEPSRSIREPNEKAQLKPESKPEKKGVFSFLRHPFRKHHPTPVATRPICPTGVCRVCPPGLARVGGACVATLLVSHRHEVCSTGEIWSGGACLFQTHFVDDCAGARLAMERQANLMDTAESARQNACTTGPTEMCMGLASRAESEASLYRTLEQRYQQCLRRTGAASSFGGRTFPAGRPNASFDHLGVDWMSRAEAAVQ